MIVDVHGHAWPFLGGASGYDDIATHLRYLQKLPAMSPHMIMEGEPPLPDEDVNFRIGKYGRLRWTKGGKECWIQWMPPCIVNMEWPPEDMIAHMDWIGVDKAVLYQSHFYGRLNDYLAQCVKKWPDRFVGTAQIEETEGDQESQIDELRHATRSLGLKALYYSMPRGLKVDEGRFDPLWEEVVSLKVPIVWDIGTRPTASEYLEVVKSLEKVMRDHPDLIGVISMMGSNIREPSHPEYIDKPKELLPLLRLPNTYFEIGYVLAYDRFEEYPYPSATRMTKAVYDEVGAEKMMWGADMPCVMRACTYRQCLDTVRIHCDFLSEDEKGLILGENARKVFNF